MTIRMHVGLVVWTWVTEILAGCFAALSAFASNADRMVLLWEAAAILACLPLLFWFLRFVWFELTEPDQQDELPAIRVRPSAVWVCRVCRTGVPKANLCAGWLNQGMQVCESCAHVAGADDIERDVA